MVFAVVGALGWTGAGAGEMGGAGGLSGGAVAGVVLGAVAGVALLAAATTLLAVRLRRRGYVGGRGCGTSGGESGKAEGEGA